MRAGTAEHCVDRVFLWSRAYARTRRCARGTVARGGGSPRWLWCGVVVVEVHGSAETLLGNEQTFGRRVVKSNLISHTIFADPSHPRGPPPPIFSRVHFHLVSSNSEARGNMSINHRNPLAIEHPQWTLSGTTHPLSPSRSTSSSTSSSTSPFKVCSPSVAYVLVSVLSPSCPHPLSRHARASAQ